MELVTVIFLLVGLALIGALMAGVWVVLTLARLIFRAVFSLFEPTPPLPPRRHGFVCSRSNCKALNDPAAHYCRRCGKEAAPARDPSLTAW